MLSKAYLPLKWDLPMNRILIDKAQDCSIRDFMRCLFDTKYSVLLKEGEATDEEMKAAFDNIQSEYIDMAGQYESGEYYASKDAMEIELRIKVVSSLLELQKQSLAQISLPYFPAFSEFKKFGYRLKWNDDFGQFTQQLDKVESGEKKALIELDMAFKMLESYRNKNQLSANEKPDRKEFIKLLNCLQRDKYTIDKEKTSMEDLAYMISEQRDQVRNMELSKSFNL
jgi:hypothetical protein